MADVKTYDFFAEGKKEFYSKFTHRSILCQGIHWEKTPLVTILIPTYNRPNLLEQALESALNQKGFTDYQIIVVDNEGKPIRDETLTARVVKNHQDDRVVYYRHDRELTNYKMDSAVRLARSPWIVFLHDDDILAENHLAVMTGIIKKHEEIKFLGCVMKEFVSEHEIRSKKSTVCNYTIAKYLRDTTCLGDWSGWLGALISRKHYIAIGGMPTISTGVGDQVMVGKFLHRFGTYMCVSGKPLYFYRRGPQQITYESRNKMETNRINEYYFYKYVINKYHKLTHRIWERNAAYTTLHVCEKYRNSNVYHSDVDIDRIITECNMPVDIQEKNARYYITKFVFSAYRRVVGYINCFYMEKFKKSDMRYGL